MTGVDAAIPLTMFVVFGLAKTLEEVCERTWRRSVWVWE